MRVDSNPLVPPGLEVVYSDSKLVVVVKPSGLLSVPGKGEEGQDSVVARVQAMFPECRRFPDVHRLDMDTSGLMVLALTARAHRELMQQFHDRVVGKRYVALLDGLLDSVLGSEGVVSLPMKRDLEDRPRQMVTDEGREAVTHWLVLGIEAGKTRVEFTPKTGRSHQLRVHAAHEQGLGVPIVGDRLYGTGTGPGQLKLHASYLRFVHPKTGDVLEFESEPGF
ncbi:MAG: RluA family pseudouridine synthase [Proteobacteria bacterium]|nr:RluA family pseudouridine synthase [Pseudomonadota bacterium]